MRLARTLLLGSLLLATPEVAAGPLHPAAPAGRIATPTSTEVLDVATRIDANTLDMALSNIGAFAYDLADSLATHGLMFPKGTTKGVVFAGGLWLGAEVAGAPRVTTSEYEPEYLPGAVVGGLPEPTGASALHVYKLFRSYASTIARDNALADYNAGAFSRGAPFVRVMPDGKLSISGDQMCWAVYNDLDPSSHQDETGGTSPLGVEVQQTNWAYSTTGALGSTEFMQYRIVNRGASMLSGIYVGMWLDPDLGGATDDLLGCDSTRSLGYCYNANNNDAQYPGQPPAVGVDLLQGPFSAAVGHRLPLTSYLGFASGSDPVNAQQSLNALRGLTLAGNPIVAPGGKQVHFMYPGDPVDGVGWVSLTGADRRMLLASGPFDIAPGGDQTVVVAIIVAQGLDRLDSVDKLRLFDDQVQSAFNAGTVALLDAPAPPAGRGLVLAPVVPNPTRGAFVVQYVLPDAGDTTLELLDVTGRRLLARALGPQGAGPHAMSLAGLPGSLAPGVYFLRLDHAGQSTTRRVAIAH